MDASGERPDILALLTKLATASLHRSRKLLLLCDESEFLLTVGQNDVNLLMRLRRLFQSAFLTRTVLMGSRRLAELHGVGMDASAFLDGFESLTWLPPLTPKETVGLHSLSMDPASDLVSDLEDLTGGHPFLVQALCSRIFEERSSPRNSIESAYHYYYDNINSAFERDYRYLAEEERAILLSVKDEEPSNEEGLYQRLALPREIVARLLFTLQQSCYVKRGTDGRYTLANDFFRKWLSEKAGRPLRELVSMVSKGAIIGVSTQPPTTPNSQTTEYDDFVLLIRAPSGNEGRYQIHVIESHEGEASGWLFLNLQSGRMKDRLRRTKENWTGENRFRTFGEMMFRAVFRRAIGEVYRKSEGQRRARAWTSVTVND